MLARLAKGCGKCDVLSAPKYYHAGHGRVCKQYVHRIDKSGQGKAGNGEQRQQRCDAANDKGSQGFFCRLLPDVLIGRDGGHQVYQRDDDNS